MRGRRGVLAWALALTLAAGALPFGGLLRADEAKPEKAETVFFASDFADYEGSASDKKASAPAGMGITNFTADQDYAIGENVIFGEAANAVKLVSKGTGKLNIYKAFNKPETIIRETKLAFEAKARFSDTAHERRLFELNTKKLGTDPYFTVISFKADGTIALGQGNKAVAAGTYEADKWYTISAKVDLEAKTFALSLNGVALPEAASLALPADWTETTYVRFGQTGDGASEALMYLDDVKFYSPGGEAPAPTPEPTAAPTAAPTPTPTPGADEPEPEGYVEYFSEDFDKYIGPTVSGGGSVKVGRMKGYNIINGQNYMTDVVVGDRKDASLGLYSKQADAPKKVMNLSKEISPALAGKLVVEASVYFEDTAHNRKALELRNIGKVDGEKPKYADMFLFDDQGKILINKKDSGLGYEAGKWYKLGLLLDTKAGQARYFINGDEVTAPGAEQLPAEWKSLYQIKFTQEGKDNAEGVMYVDDIRIYAGSKFMAKPSLDDLKVQKTLLGWDVLYVSGEPDVELARSPEGDGEVIRMVMASNGEVPCLRKVFKAGALKNYAADSWVLVETKGDIKFETEARPMKDGKVMLGPDGKEIVYRSHNNTRGDSIGNERIRIRAYFETPEGCDAVQVKHIAQGASTVYLLSSDVKEMASWGDRIGRFDSGEISHPIGDAVLDMFCSWQLNPFKNETQADWESRTAVLRSRDEGALIAEARKSAESRQYLDTHPEMEAQTRRLAQLYQATGDETLARKAILIMREFALQYPDVPRLIQDNDLFHAHGKYIPMEPLYAYDLIYNAASWDALKKELGADVRAEVEDWFRSAFMNLYNIHNDVYYSNITPYGIRNAMGVAVILNDPDIVRMMLPWIDTMLSGRQFHADGMWQEGTISYGSQVVNNIKLALHLLETSFKDPAGYTDDKFRLKLDHTDLTGKWPLLEKSIALNSVFRFPNGARVALHDTWAFGQKKGDPVYTAQSPILPEYLGNTELWQFGHYSLKQGDTNEATQVNLSFPPMSEGLPYAAGHYHGNHLGITLWGSGIEALPDSGYPKGANRYFNMDTESHNAAWVYDENADDYPAHKSLWVRPSLLAYDDGLTSGKEVQLIEASSPGPVEDLTKMKRRLLLLVRTEGNRSYVLDLQRLQGGQAHELFMHASEDESCSMTTSLDLKQAGATLADYIASTGNAAGLKKYRTMFRDPQAAAGDKDFSFVWRGKDSGSSLNVHMNGVAGSEAVFSMMPTNRRTMNQNAKMDDYPNWAFYRRNLVDSSDITRFGAVYETTRDGQSPMVGKVTWALPDNADGMCQIAKVDMGAYTDVVYISDDTAERSFEGMTFAGKTAVARLDRDGNCVWAYVYGEGVVKVKDYVLRGAADLRYHVTATQGEIDPKTSLDPNFVPAENAIFVDGSVPKGLEGVWLRTAFGDGSGYGMRIVGTSGSEIMVHDVPAFTPVEGGARMDFFPAYENSETGLLNLHAGDQELYRQRVIPGDIVLEIRRPGFARNEAEPPQPTEPTETAAPSVEPSSRPTAQPGTEPSALPTEPAVTTAPEGPVAPAVTTGDAETTPAATDENGGAPGKTGESQASYMAAAAIGAGLLPVIYLRLRRREEA